MLSIAGLQVPLIAFVEVVGKAAIVLPAQNGPTALKVGVTFGLTTIVNVVDVAHCPAEGTKEYVVVVVLLIAGLQFPAIPLVEFVGRAGIAAPEQKGPTALNVGVTFGFITIVSEVVRAHCPLDGVKV